MSATVLQWPQRVPRSLSRIGTLAMSRRSAVAARVLGYLERCRRFAELSHRRDLAFDYERAWRLVFEVSHGALPPARVFSTQYSVVSEPAPRPVPKWKAEVLARPMRRVVERQNIAGRL